MARLLIVYYANDHVLKNSVRDHLYCFRQNGKHHCYYLNLAVNSTHAVLRKHFDLVIFQTMFFSCRWNPLRYQRLVQESLPLAKIKAVKAIIPQDEFYHADLLNEFVNKFNIDYVFTSASESDWPAIYRDIDRTRVKLKQVLTGYISERLIRQIKLISKTQEHNVTDISYRAWRASPWLGNHGRHKVAIAQAFQEKTKSSDLITDISTKRQDTLYGDHWLRLLLSSRYTIGVEGGATILDFNGNYREQTADYFNKHPNASNDEVTQHCFPEAEGSLNLRAISPRHLEACVTKTCQILVEGKYNGVLEPNKHYIPLSEDYSNIDEVISSLHDENKRKQIVQRAYDDIVESGKYGYDEFVDSIIEHCLPNVVGNSSQQVITTTSNSDKKN